VYSWGKNKYGQLGLGHTNNVPLPTGILSLSDPLNRKNVRSIGAGKSHSAVIAEDGDVYTWGRGWEGQLGHDVVTEIELEPHIVPKMENRGSSAVACGRNHTVVVTDNGLIYTWGENKAGQLGTGDLKSSNSPVLIDSALNLPSVLSIACGEFHTVAICIEGTIWSWGRNQCGQLGHGNTKTCYFPTQVVGMAKKICIRAACGGQHTLVLTDANKIYAWGSNAYGQLGLNRSDKAVLQPDIVDHLRRSGACHVLCGYSHSMALMKNEQIYTWGRNDCGQLGLGHYTHSPVPELVTALRSVRVQQIACGYDHCVAFVADEVEPGMPPLEHVYSWGRGEEGQLGHNELLSRCTPRIVE
ncbi:hypothetical protein GUITHDRAFT_46944, partial [Guillardia theta CCMP2712]